MKFCYHCQNEIPAERLEILPDTDTCVNCSKVKPVIGVVQGGGSMSASTKESQLVIMSGDNKLARAFVNSRKGRSWGKGVGGSNLSGTASDV